MKPIPQVLLNQTWQRLIHTPPEQAQAVLERTGERQPFIMAYVLPLENELPDEQRGQHTFIAVFILESMGAVAVRPLPQISPEKIEAAEAANIQYLQSLETTSETAYLEAVGALIDSYNQVALLRSIMEILMEGNENQPNLSPESVGTALLHYKTVIDCLDQAA